MADDAPATEPKPRRTRTKKPEAPAAEPAKPESATPKAPKAPRRPTLDPELGRLLEVRRAAAKKRARFTRQASYRYWRIGRDGAWRKPRGLQSKQRRHYAYRSAIVRIGYRGPAAARGRTPTGFDPVLVRNAKEIDGIDPARQAIIIARGVGTRRRLTLEESARQKGIHVLNPILHDAEETT